MKLAPSKRFGALPAAGEGLPADWVSRMRESMACLTSQFSSNRMLREYTEDYYMPLAEAYRQRSADANAAAALEAWSAQLKQHWQRIHFGNVTSRENENGHYFEVQLYLDDMDVDAVSVELYADSVAGSKPLRRPLSRGAALAGTVNAYVYTGLVATDRPASDYTPRVIPAHPQASVPLEANLILWYR